MAHVIEEVALMPSDMLIDHNLLGQAISLRLTHRFAWFIMYCAHVDCT